MKKIIYLSILIGLITKIALAQTNINISNTSGWDTEPYIAINPTNSNNIVAAWMHISGFAIGAGTSYSMDAGLTWSTPIARPHLHVNFTSADVSLAFNNSGELFLCYIDVAVSNDSGYVMVAKSVDGGASWGSPVKVFNALSTPDFPIDRPWIAIDKSGGAYNGRIYVVTKSVEFGAMPHHIWMKYSADNGATWSAQTLVDDSIPTNLITNAMGVPTVGADGNFYVGYVSYDPPSSAIPRVICLKSTDGGVSFIPKVAGYAVVGSGITDTLYQGSYTLNANPALAGNLVYTFTDQRNGDPDVLSVHSNDGGNSWTPPIRVNDDVISNGVGQDMCWANFSNTGKYAVVWRDRRNTGGTSSSSFETYTSVSTDGGSSFKPNNNLNSMPSPFINIQKGNDFIGVCLDDNYVYSDWCDLRAGNTETFVNKTAMPVLIGITENSKTNDMQLKVFPNPSSGSVTISFSVKQKQELSITFRDVQGKIIKTVNSQLYSIGDQQLKMNLTDMAAGSYLLSVQADNKNILASLMISIK